MLMMAYVCVCACVQLGYVSTNYTKLLSELSRAIAASDASLRLVYSMATRTYQYEYSFYLHCACLFLCPSAYSPAHVPDLIWLQAFGGTYLTP